MAAAMLRTATAVGYGAARQTRVCHLHQAHGAASRVLIPASVQQAGALRWSSQHTTPISQSSSSFRRYATRLVVACASDTSTIELEVKVEGMKCGGCSSRVEAALKAMDHVKGVQVDLESKLATVEVEAPNLIDAMNMLPNFVNTIKELGFEAEPHIEYQL